MMKHILIVIFIILSSEVYCQNLQIHYDYGKDRNFFTTTFEMFNPDDYGSTFWFIDFDFNQKGNKSISKAYLEIARYIKIEGCNWFEPTIQYNDGIADWGRLGPIWLGGIKRGFDLEYFKFNTELLYRNDYFSDGKDAQITITWNELYFDLFCFKGFFDIWTAGKDKKFTVVLTEPQIWMRVWKHLSFGIELEFSNNFIAQDLFQINPTVALNWNFSYKDKVSK